MLYLIRQLKRDVPVIYLEGFPHPTKHSFPAQIEREWGLGVIRPRPQFRDVIAKSGHVELIEVFEVAPDRVVYFPIEAEPDYVPGPNSDCAIERLSLPCLPSEMGFDCIFIGHRGDDVDPTHGALPLVESVVDCGDFRFVYPLRDWTEEDVWEVSERLGIPQNRERYGLTEGMTIPGGRDFEVGDTGANNDYYPLCTDCLKPGVEGDFIRCPKTGKQVPAVGKRLRLEEQREEWRRAFVNISN